MSTRLPQQQKARKVLVLPHAKVEVGQLFFAAPNPLEDLYTSPPNLVFGGKLK